MMGGHEKDVVSQTPEKLSAVAGHVCVTVDKLMIVWGGYYMMKMEERHRNPAHLYVYHTEFEKWIRFQTDGDVPGKNSGCCCVVVDLTLYIFGGFFTRLESSNALYALDLRLMRWSRVVPTSPAMPTPRHKLVGWHQQNKLYFFGGFGPPPSFLMHTGNDAPPQYLARYGTFVSDINLRYPSAWNSQLICFDLETGSWSEVQTQGAIPRARAAHAAVKTPDGRVLVFGGRHQDRRLNDLHVLNLGNFVWTAIDINPRPIGRSWHSFSQLGPEEFVLYGGFTSNKVPLSDVWLLSGAGEWSWRRASELECGKQRLWHTGVVVDRVLHVYGGCDANILEPDSDREYCRDMVVIRRQPKSLLQQCVAEVSGQRHRSFRGWEYLPSSVRRKLIFAQQTQFRPDIRSVRDLLFL